MAADLEPIVLDAANPGPMTGAGNRTYLLPGADGRATLIDAGVGVASHLEALAAGLAALNMTLGRVVVTHAHGDHISGAVAIHDQYPEAAFCKWPWPSEDRKFPLSWRALADGDVVPIAAGALEVVHTPGHAPDHCVLWHAPTATVFSGDLVIPGGSVVIQTHRDGRMRDYLRSLERVIALAPQRLWPAHGGLVPQPLRLLRASLAHRLEREAQVLEALRRGLGTVAAMAESIYDGLPAGLMPAAQENVLAHLTKLADERRARYSDGQWVPGDAGRE